MNTASWLAVLRGIAHAIIIDHARRFRDLIRIVTCVVIRLPW